MRSDSQTRSLHYVHSYAVKDRVDFSSLPHEVPTEVNIYDILDYQELKNQFSVHVSCIIVKYLPFFTDDFH